MRASVWARTVCAILLTAAAPGSGTTSYHIDPAGSTIGAKVGYFGLSSRTMQFPDVSGSIILDPARPQAAHIAVNIDARTLTASDSMTVDTLKSESFFWVDQHPQITFTSDGLTFENATTATASGTLTARGVSRPSTLKVTLAQPLSATEATHTINLTAQTVIDRRDFGMTAYPFIVGNKVEVSIKAHLVAD